MQTAAWERAAEMVAEVRDDPPGRLRLAATTYGTLGSWADAELGFMRWEVERGVLNPPGDPHPGSPWWRSVNEGLLRDAAEASLLHAGATGDPSTTAVTRWVEFFGKPSPRAWYRAHNSSVVAGYWAHAELAVQELREERHLMNLTLVRVLYAQALEEDAKLGLGVLSHIGRMVADPRAMGVSEIVHVPDLYPRRYPLDRLEEAALEHRLPTLADGLVALFDDVIVFPRLRTLFALGAKTLSEPSLPSLVRKDRPCYPEALLDPSAAETSIAPHEAILGRLWRALLALLPGQPKPPSAAEATARAEAVIAGAPPVHHNLPWVCAQRWEQVLFASWRVPVDVVRALVPPELELDLHDGSAWVSMLPLKMAHVHLRDLPGMPTLTNFPELNLRTYVRYDDEPGVYFFSLDAPSRLAVWIGRHIFHVNYDAARMSMRVRRGRVTFKSERESVRVPATFSATYAPTSDAHPAATGSVEMFLCERYAMYGVDHEKRVVRGDIRHSPWLLRDVDLELDARSVLAAAGLDLETPDHLAFSDATDNVVWPMVHLKPEH